MADRWPGRGLSRHDGTVHRLDRYGRAACGAGGITADPTPAAAYHCPLCTAITRTERARTTP